MSKDIISEDTILEELKKLLTNERIHKLEHVLSHRTDQLTIVLDHIAHEHNISAVIRSADAFGISTIHIISDKEKLHAADFSEGISLGSEKWIRLKHYNSYEELLNSLKASNYALVALLPPEKSEKSVPVSLLPFESPLALMFGNEVRGLSKELIEKADIHAYIPMFGFAESLNISVSCAITLYSSTLSKTEPQRRAAELAPDLKKEIHADWIRKSVQNVNIVEKNLRSRLISKE